MSDDPQAYLSVPYELVVDSVQREDGEWVRRAAYPELGVATEDADVLAALDALDGRRQDKIAGLIEAGRPVPAPRPALRGGQDAGFGA